MRISHLKSTGIIAALVLIAVFSVLVIFAPSIALLASLLTVVVSGGILVASHWLNRGSKVSAKSKKAPSEQKRRA